MFLYIGVVLFIALLLWAMNTYTTLDPTAKKILTLGIGLLVVIWLCSGASQTCKGVSPLRPSLPSPSGVLP